MDAGPKKCTDTTNVSPETTKVHVATILGRLTFSKIQFSANSLSRSALVKLQSANPTKQSKPKTIEYGLQKKSGLTTQNSVSLEQL